MRKNIHFPKYLENHSLPSKSLYKEPLSWNRSRVVKSLKVSLDISSRDKTILYLKRVSKVHHLTIRTNLQMSQFKRYFLKKSRYFLRVSQLRCFSVTLEAPDTITNTYQYLEKFFKNCTTFEVYQYGADSLSNSSLLRSGSRSNIELVRIDSVFLKPKLQADALRIIPIFQSLTHLDLSLNMSYESLPSTDSSVLKDTVGKLNNLRILELANTATSQVQTGAHLNDISAVFSQLKNLEKVSLNINLWDSETNIVRKLVGSIQNLKKLIILEMKVNIMNQQFYNKSPQIEASNLNNLKKLTATANNLPEERLLLTTMCNCKALLWIDLSVSVASKDNYKMLTQQIRNNKDLETLVLKIKFNVSIAGLEELAEAIQGSQALKRIVLKLTGKSFPLDRGLKKLLLTLRNFPKLTHLAFEASKEFEASARGIAEIFEQVGELKGLKTIILSLKLLEKMEKKGIIRKVVAHMDALETCDIEINGMSFSREFHEDLNEIMATHKSLKTIRVTDGKSYVL